MIPERYRSDYDGEFVIVNTIFKNGKKEQEREWVDSPIENKHLGRATCIAKGPSTQRFKFNALENHQGGLLGSKSMQIYGVDDVFKELKCNFLVSTNQYILDEIKEKNYQEDTIVYTTPRLCIANAGEFYLIPHGFKSTTHAIALWLACFDEHKEIFLFGYDEVDNNGNEQLKLIQSVNEVIKAYPDVQYYFVHNNTNMPDLFKYHLNMKSMTIQEYVSYADV
jgi:hypothetical protein